MSYSKYIYFSNPSWVYLFLKILVNRTVTRLLRHTKHTTKDTKFCILLQKIFNVSNMFFSQIAFPILQYVNISTHEKFRNSHHRDSLWIWYTFIKPSPLSAEGWTFYQIFKRIGLTGPQFLEWGCWERGGDFFREKLKFLVKK